MIYKIRKNSFRICYMIYNYILKNFNCGDPIFLSEIPSKSKSYLRLAVKKLVDKGLLERFYNGVYFLPYKTILGTKGKISFDKFIEKKFLYSSNNQIDISLNKDPSESEKKNIKLLIEEQGKGIGLNLKNSSDIK